MSTVMSITSYTRIMGCIWFTLALLADGLLIRYNKRIHGSVLLLIFSLGLIRLLVPLEIMGYTVTFFDDGFYLFLENTVQKEVLHYVSVAGLLLWLWGIGSMIALLRFFYQLWQLHQVVLRSRDITQDEALFDRCRQLAAQMGYAGSMKVAVTAEFSTAVSAGLFSPVILIPERLLQFPESELEGIIRHELMHYLRRDVGKQWGLCILRCLFWWNPVVWFLKKSVEQWLELQCDAKVCEALSEPEKITYLEGILRVLRENRKEGEGLGVGYARSQTGAFVQQRFGEVLWPVHKQSKGQNALIGVLCIVIFAASYRFLVQPYCLPNLSEIEGENVSMEPPHGVEEERDFILKYHDGTYVYYKDMNEYAILKEEELGQSPYAELTIIEASMGE
ncbi:MAG: M56 family metallopeptidase [Lachnospiraceae bacterium]|nr:M56 family metallopeptidase [Lachnospiraceae bacterium]